MPAAATNAAAPTISTLAALAFMTRFLMLFV
jgi:hypothetical protein